MNAGDAFLGDIIEHPDDDAPRLIYADWLDDQGQPERAEFIRLQCLLASLPQDDPSRPEYQERERQLLDAHKAEWAAELKRIVKEANARSGSPCSSAALCPGLQCLPRCSSSTAGGSSIGHRSGACICRISPGESNSN
jgi:uncharacterized protein (TIGR02996 family)